MSLFKFLKCLLSILTDNRAAWTTEMTVTGISEIDAAIPNYWAAGIMHDANRESFWGQLAGKEGSFLPVIDKTGPLKQKGDYISFNVIDQLMGAGVTGESVLKGNEEKLYIGTFSVACDYVRNAVSVSKKSTKQANFDEVQTARQLLKDWATRRYDSDVFTAITGAASIETLYANNDTTEAGLCAGDGDYFNPNDLLLMNLALKRIGAMPLKVSKVNGRSVPVYGCVFSDVDEYYLTANANFRQVLREAWERFKGANGDHPLFRGAVGIYHNMILYPYWGVLPIPQGTPLRPETTLSATLTTTATTASVGVAAHGNSKADYTAFFASSGSIQIEDEIISYTGKSISSFTGLTRGASSTTAAQHTAGKLVTQRNVSRIIGFGAEAVFRAMPDDWTAVGENDDYGAQIGLGIEGYYGHSVRTDSRRGKAANVVLLKAFSKNPGTI